MELASAAVNEEGESVRMLTSRLESELVIDMATRSPRSASAEWLRSLIGVLGDTPWYYTMVVRIRIIIWNNNTYARNKKGKKKGV